MKTTTVLMLSLSLIACSNKAKEEPKDPAALTFKEKTVEVLQDEKNQLKGFCKECKRKNYLP